MRHVVAAVAAVVAALFVGIPAPANADVKDRCFGFDAPRGFDPRVCLRLQYTVSPQAVFPGRWRVYVVGDPRFRHWALNNVAVIIWDDDGDVRYLAHPDEVYKNLSGQAQERGHAGFPRITTTATVRLVGDARLRPRAGGGRPFDMVFPIF